MSKRAAERLIFRQLGTRFGFAGACNELSISSLWEDLLCEAPDRPEREAAAAGAAMRKCAATQGQQVACREQTCLDDAEEQHPACATLGEGALAARCVDAAQLFEQALQLLRDAPAAAQAKLLDLAMSNVTALKHACEAAKNGFGVPTGKDFAGADGGSLLRKRSVLEKAPVKRKRAHAASHAGDAQPARAAHKHAEAPTPQEMEHAVGGADAADSAAVGGSEPTAAQANFAHGSDCEKRKQYQITKAWDGGRTARQAAQHYQNCLLQGQQRNGSDSGRSGGRGNQAASGAELGRRKRRQRQRSSDSEPDGEASAPVGEHNAAVRQQPSRRTARGLGQWEHLNAHESDAEEGWRSA